MTETNINALCSVEAVFDGIDIEVTVEFSAGGGTFEHDELTAESRAKSNQHPIASITGLQSALDGKANSAHVHTISDVTGLQLALDGKSNIGHGHHKESITGLTILDTPEFADTQITSLSAEATYTPTVWAYLVSLFTTVPKSVKEHIVKIWERLGLLEDKYMLKYVVPVDTVAVDLTLDKYGNAFNFVEGDQFMVIIKAVFLSSNRLEIMVNNISSAVYYFHSTASATTRIVPAFAASTIQFTESTISIVDSEIYYKLFYRYPSTSGTIGGYTIGANLSSINKIKIFASTNNIPAGTIIIIKKV